MRLLDTTDNNVMLDFEFAAEVNEIEQALPAGAGLAIFEPNSEGFSPIMLSALELETTINNLWMWANLAGRPTSKLKAPLAGELAVRCVIHQVAKQDRNDFDL